LQSPPISGPDSINGESIEVEDHLVRNGSAKKAPEMESLLTAIEEPGPEQIARLALLPERSAVMRAARRMRLFSAAEELKQVPVLAGEFRDTET
jgi:hypothetical protein